jgi:hypothetical protein
VSIGVDLQQGSCPQRCSTRDRSPRGRWGAIGRDRRRPRPRRHQVRTAPPTKPSLTAVRPSQHAGPARARHARNHGRGVHRARSVTPRTRRLPTPSSTPPNISSARPLAPRPSRLPAPNVAQNPRARTSRGPHIAGSAVGAESSTQPIDPSGFAVAAPALKGTSPVHLRRRVQTVDRVRAGWRGNGRRRGRPERSSGAASSRVVRPGGRGPHEHAGASADR